jgi:hypothetical protein
VGCGACVSGRTVAGAVSVAVVVIVVVVAFVGVVVDVRGIGSLAFVWVLLWVIGSVRIVGRWAMAGPWSGMRWGTGVGDFGRWGRVDRSSSAWRPQPVRGASECHMHCTTCELA